MDAVETERDAGNNCSPGVHATVGPTVSVSDARAAEGKALTFPVNLSEARETDIEVTWKTVGGQAVADIDFRHADRGTLEIPAGTSEGTISVETVADDAAEGEDTFGVQLVDVRPSSPTGVVLSIDGSAAVGTIIDDDGDPDVADFQLRDAIRIELNRTSHGPVTVEDLESLSRIWASDRGIESLSGVEAATNVTVAWLWNNRITDVLPLAHLVRLEQLILNDNPLTNLSPLAYLGSLKDLRLSRTGISDVRELQTLGGLRILELRNNGIAQLSPLAGLTRLVELTLSGNRITHLSPLSALTRLRVLRLDGNRISDLSPLEGLSRLRRLDLADNAIADISPLGSLTGLQYLGLRGNRIADLSSLSSITFLASLDLGGNRIADLAPLAGSQFLNYLELADNDIRDIEPLAGLTRLKSLDLSNNAVADLAPLVANAGFSLGDTLNLLGNPLSDEAIRIHVPALRDRGIDVTHIGISIAAGSAPEGQTLSFPVRLTFPADEDLALDYSVASLSASEDTDYSDAGSGSVTIAPGVTEASIDLFTNDDELAEPHEALSVTLNAPEGGLAGGVAIVGATAGGIIVDAGAPVAEVPLFAEAGHDTRQGFIRVLNGGMAGAVRIDAVDDSAGRRATTLSLKPGETIHLNSQDLEEGNAAKGLLDGIGDGQGDWRLEVRGETIEALTYVRTPDGFLTSLHDLVPKSPDGYEVQIFNPARNVNQVSLLRLTNPGTADAKLTVSGIDDLGQRSAGAVRLTLAAGESRTASAQQLESGAGLDGALDEGSGKWRLRVVSDQPIRVMNLLESPTGHLSNLSTMAERGSISDGTETMYRVPLFPSAADATGQEGFVRVINRDDEPAEVRITARDDTRRVYDPLTLSLDAGAAGQFNSYDLESGGTRARVFRRA